MYQLESEKVFCCTLSAQLYLAELDDLYVPHKFYIQNAYQTVLFMGGFAYSN